MATLAELRAKYNEYESAKNSIDSAILDIGEVSGKLVTLVSAINEGVKPGGKTGLDLDKLPEQELYIEYMKTNLSSASSYCSEKMKILDAQIKALTPPVPTSEPVIIHGKKDKPVPATAGGPKFILY